MAKRSYKLTSTTTPQAVSNYDTRTLFNHVCIINLSDGDIEVYFENTNINIIAPTNVQTVLDKFPFSGQAYYYNMTGSGGDIVLTVWQDEEK